MWLKCNTYQVGFSFPYLTAVSPFTLVLFCLLSVLVRGGRTVTVEEQIVWQTFSWIRFNGAGMLYIAVGKLYRHCNLQF